MRGKRTSRSKQPIKTSVTASSPPATTTQDPAVVKTAKVRQTNKIKGSSAFADPRLGPLTDEDIYLLDLTSSKLTRKERKARGELIERLQKKQMELGIFNQARYFRGRRPPDDLIAEARSENTVAQRDIGSLHYFVLPSGAYRTVPRPMSQLHADEIDDVIRGLKNRPESFIVAKLDHLCTSLKIHYNDKIRRRREEQLHRAYSRRRKWSSLQTYKAASLDPFRTWKPPSHAAAGSLTRPSTLEASFRYFRHVTDSQARQPEASPSRSVEKAHSHLAPTNSQGTSTSGANKGRPGDTDQSTHLSLPSSLNKLRDGAQASSTNWPAELYPESARYVVQPWIASSPQSHRPHGDTPGASLAGPSRQLGSRRPTMTLANLTNVEAAGSSYGEESDEALSSDSSSGHSFRASPKPFSEGDSDDEGAFQEENMEPGASSPSHESGPARKSISPPSSSSSGSTPPLTLTHAQRSYLSPAQLRLLETPFNFLTDAQYRRKRLLIRLLRSDRLPMRFVTRGGGIPEGLSPEVLYQMWHEAIKDDSIVWRDVAESRFFVSSLKTVFELPLAVAKRQAFRIMKLIRKYKASHHERRSYNFQQALNALRRKDHARHGQDGQPNDEQPGRTKEPEQTEQPNESRESGDEQQDDTAFSSLTPLFALFDDQSEDEQEAQHGVGGPHESSPPNLQDHRAAPLSPPYSLLPRTRAGLSQEKGKQPAQQEPEEDNEGYLDTETARKHLASAVRFFKLSPSEKRRLSNVEKAMFAKPWRFLSSGKHRHRRELTAAFLDARQAKCEPRLPKPYNSNRLVKEDVVRLNVDDLPPAEEEMTEESEPENVDDDEISKDLQDGRLAHLRAMHLRAPSDRLKVNMTDRGDGRRYFVFSSGKMRSMPIDVAERYSQDIADSIWELRQDRMNELRFIQNIKIWLAGARQEKMYENRSRWRKRKRPSS